MKKNRYSNVFSHRNAVDMAQIENEKFRHQSGGGFFLMKITRYIFRFPFSLSFFLCFIHLIVDVVCSKSFVRCVNMDVLCFFIRGERKWVMSTEFRFSYLIRVRWWCFKYNWDWSKCLCRQENMLIRMFFSVCVCAAAGDTSI